MESRFSQLAVVTWFKEALFPACCVRCGSEGSAFCASCRATWLPTPIISQPAGAITSHFALCPYKDRVIQTLIGEWKYHGVTAAREELLAIMERTVRDYGDALPVVDAVTFVPLHWRKKNLRGFDQAEVAAAHLAMLLHVPLLGALERTRFTEQQAQIERTDRQKSDFAAVFAVRKGVRLPKRLLLVDDVWTTGATLSGAAETLRSGGAERIDAFTLAKG